MSNLGMNNGGSANKQVPHSVKNTSSNPYANRVPQVQGSAASPKRGGKFSRVAEDSNLPHNGQKLKSSATGRGNNVSQKGKKAAGGKNGGSGNKHGASFWVAIVVALVAVGLACVLAFTLLGPKSARQGDEGQLEGKTPEEIQAELDRIVEEGMFNISIASVIEFPDGASPGEVRIENVPGNVYMMKVVITRDDTNEVIYTTDFIEPNHHVQQDKLAVDLPAGTYDCTAMFYAHDAKTEELIGQAAAKIVVKVLS